MTIRPATERDYTSISELTSACYRVLAGRDNYTKAELAGLLAECSSLESIRRQYAAFTVLVAEEAGAIVGVVATDGNEITQLFVLPRAQHREIGRQLVAAAELQIRAAGHRKAWVYTASAATYYERVGYTPTEQRVCAEGPLKGRLLVVLEKSLDPVSTTNPSPSR
jgi:N-acetylglutamate synthase-like GNAT family acetyltransferase